MFPIFYSDRFLAHQTGLFHPENPGRLAAIVEALHAAPWADQIDWQEPPDREVLSHIYRVHTPEFVAQVAHLSEVGGGYLDEDTPVAAQSYAVASLAVSAWLSGVDVAWQKKQPVFVVARPPGHHARSDSGMGFCIFSNAAIAAFYARTIPGIDRVAILDWDVHHGNGTQEALWSEATIAFVSIHQSHFYPGSGREQEQGAYHQILNLPIPAGSAGETYDLAFREAIVPFLRQFSPDLLIVSAGFDGNSDDPLAHMNLKPEDFANFTRYCLEITPKIVFGLEGGYDYCSLSRSVYAVIDTCLHYPPI